MPSKSNSKFTFDVDDEPVPTDEHELTAAEILRLADRDPDGFDLRRIKGGPKATLKDSDVVKINNGLAFVTVSTGPTPVK